MTEISVQELNEYIQKVEDSMTRQWDNMNRSINAFEISLQKQRDAFEEKHLKMLKDIHKETQICVSDLHSKSNDIRELVTVVRDKLSYVATTQNLDGIAIHATEAALKATKSFINKGQWDENLHQLFTYIEGITDAIGEFSKIIFTYDLRLRKDHPSLFKEVTNRKNEFLDLPIHEAEFSVRTSNCLGLAGCKTLRDVLDRGEEYLIKQRNFGKKSLKELRQKFEDKGVKW